MKYNLPFLSVVEKFQIYENLMAASNILDIEKSMKSLL